MDNASNNQKMMEYLAKSLEDREIPFSATDRRILCFPHIINLCAQRAMTAMTQQSTEHKGDFSPRNVESEVLSHDSGSDSDDSGSNSDDSGSDSDYVRSSGNGGRENFLVRCRRFVKAMRSSGQRREAFERFIDMGNKNDMFRDSEGDAIQVQNLQLLRDVKTRWDSVFSMLRRLRELRPVR